MELKPTEAEVIIFAGRMRGVGIMKPQGYGEIEHSKVRELLTEFLNRRPEPAAQADCGTSFYWLVEAPGQKYLAVQRLSMSDNFEWTTDHNKALRFVSQEQADALMMALRQMDRSLDSSENHGKLSWGKLFAFEPSLGNAKAVEHGWLVAAPGSSPARPEPVNEQMLLEALQEAEDALRDCYDVQFHPADGNSSQDQALAKVRSALSARAAKADGGA